jgi:hypothetical protein
MDAHNIIWQSSANEQCETVHLSDARSLMRQTGYYYFVNATLLYGHMMSSTFVFSRHTI